MSTPPRAALGERLVNWWFRDRGTGRLVLAQAPNAAIVVWGVASALGALDLPAAREQELRWVGTGALLVWGLDELVRGATPFRRLLGVVVLGWQLARFVAP